MERRYRKREPWGKPNAADATAEKDSASISPRSLAALPLLRDLGQISSGEVSGRGNAMVGRGRAVNSEKKCGAAKFAGRFCLRTEGVKIVRGGAWADSISVAALCFVVVLVEGAQGQEAKMKCYAGVSYNRVATEPINPSVLVPKPGVKQRPSLSEYPSGDLMSPTLPEVECNDTIAQIYTGCYSVCQNVLLKNHTATRGTLDYFEINVCKYGCLTDVQSTAIKRWNGGALQLDFMCDCRWDRSEPFWTDRNVDFKGPVFCCPNCHWDLGRDLTGMSTSPAACSDEYSLKIKTCTAKKGPLCNLNQGGTQSAESFLVFVLSYAALFFAAHLA